MGSWAEVPLGDVCHVIGGGTPSKSNAAYYTGSIPWATVRDMNTDVISGTDCQITEEAVRSSSTNVIPAGNVVIATRVGLGKVCLLERDTAVNQDLRGIVPKQSDSVVPRYLFYWFKLVAPSIVAAGTGATVQGVKVDFVKSLRLALPNLFEQEQIVAILDEAFAAIATATANAEKSHVNARELFESRLNAIFERGVREWTTERFGNLCSFVRGPFGGSLKKSCFVESGFAVYEQRHAIDNQFDRIRYFIDEHKFSEMSRFELRPDDIIMSCSGSMGRVAVAPQDLKRGVINQALLKLTPGPDSMSEFLKLWMRSASFQEQISLHSKGAAIKNVASVRVLKEIAAPLPHLEEQRAVIEGLTDFECETENLHLLAERKVALIAELKQSILHKAFTGELTADFNTADVALPKGEA